MKGKQPVSKAGWKEARELKKANYQALRFFNVDETGITTVHRKHNRVITLKDKKQTTSLPSL
jgi:hypothetical protein